MPFDFARKPRKFQNVRRIWKAHELRQFLLITGPVVLRDVLNEDLYINFLHLHVLITILVNPLLCTNQEYLNFADALAKNFVSDFKILYGSYNVSHNVHNILHLVNDVRNYGSVDNFSAYRFENNIRKVKQLVRKGEKPLQQIHRRLAEIGNFQNFPIIEEDDFALQTMHCNGPILPTPKCQHQFQILRQKSLSQCYRQSE